MRLVATVCAPIVTIRFGSRRSRATASFAAQSVFPERLAPITKSSSTGASNPHARRMAGANASHSSPVRARTPRLMPSVTGLSFSSAEATAQIGGSYPCRNGSAARRPAR